MHGASALVYPSLCEGFGLPILEALALGTTVVVSESAVPNVLRKQCTVLPATDIAAWQHCLERTASINVRERQARRAIVGRSPGIVVRRQPPTATANSWRNDETQMGGASSRSGCCKLAQYEHLCIATCICSTAQHPLPQPKNVLKRRHVQLRLA